MSLNQPQATAVQVSASKEYLDCDLLGRAIRGDLAAQCSGPQGPSVSPGSPRALRGVPAPCPELHMVSLQPQGTGGNTQHLPSLGLPGHRREMKCHLLPSQGTLRCGVHTRDVGTPSCPLASEVPLWLRPCTAEGSLWPGGSEPVKLGLCHLLSPPATRAVALSQEATAREQKPCLSKDFFFIFII